MNQRGVDMLVAAALAGRRQARYRLEDGDARCALGVLFEAISGVERINTLTFDRFDLCWEETIRAYDLTRLRRCPDCMTVMREINMISHLNDEHNWDFLTIARKLGPEVAS